MQQRCHLFFFFFFFFPAMQLNHRVTSLEEVYQITCSFLWSHIRLYTKSITYAVVLPKTCKHTLMFKMVRVTL